MKSYQLIIMFTLCCQLLAAQTLCAATKDPKPKLQAIPSSAVQSAPMPANTMMQQPRPVKLEGKAEVIQQTDNRMLVAWQASQFYQYGAWALGTNNFQLAADAFRRAGNGFQYALGPSKFLAESRYAESQAWRMQRQNGYCLDLLKIAIPMLQQFDPQSPFIQKGMICMQQMSGTTARTRRPPLKGKIEAEPALPPILTPMDARLAKIDREVKLKANLMVLADGTSTTSLGESELFNGSKQYHLAAASETEVSDKFIKGAVYNSFLKMNCIEFGNLGGNYYTAVDEYKPLISNGKVVIVGASADDDVWNSYIKLRIGNRDYTIGMDLPDIKGKHKNVILATDGAHLLAIDPRLSESWQLAASLSKKHPDFEWHKLTHQRPAPHLYVKPKPKAK